MLLCWVVALVVACNCEGVSCRWPFGGVRVSDCVCVSVQCARKLHDVLAWDLDRPMVVVVMFIAFHRHAGKNKNTSNKPLKKNANERRAMALTRHEVNGLIEDGLIAGVPLLVGAGIGAAVHDRSPIKGALAGAGIVAAIEVTLFGAGLIMQEGLNRYEMRRWLRRVRRQNHAMHRAQLLQAECEPVGAAAVMPVVEEQRKRVWTTSAWWKTKLKASSK
jgi:hypothetical protein